MTLVDRHEPVWGRREQMMDFQNGVAGLVLVGGLVSELWKAKSVSGEVLGIEETTYGPSACILLVKSETHE